MKRKIFFLLSILAASAAFVFTWQANSRSYARTLLDDDDPTYNAERSNITNLLASKSYHQACVETATTLRYIVQKPSQPKFVTKRKAMELFELTAQANTGMGRPEKTVQSHEQIIKLYPFPKFDSAAEEAQWNQANGLALNAVQQLVDDYRRINQIDAGVAFFQFVQKKYANSPVASAASAAEKRLRSGK
jgi:hypothetical protein